VKEQRFIKQRGEKEKKSPHRGKDAKRLSPQLSYW
jgi:hypothetical protein